MSLRHLYKDINSLGIYPDLIHGNKSGRIYPVVNKDMNETIYTNKYYGCKYIKMKLSLGGYHVRRCFTKMEPMIVKLDGDQFITTFTIGVNWYYLTYDVFESGLVYYLDDNEILTTKDNFLTMEFIYYVLDNQKYIHDYYSLLNIIKSYVHNVK